MVMYARRFSVLLILTVITAAGIAYGKLPSRTQMPPMPVAHLVTDAMLASAAPRDITLPIPDPGAKEPEIDAARAVQLAIARAGWELGRSDLVPGSVVPLVGPDGEVEAWDVDFRFDGGTFASPAQVYREWRNRLWRAVTESDAQAPSPPRESREMTFFSVTVAATYDVRSVRASRPAPSNLHASGPRMASVAAGLLGIADPILERVYPQSSWARAYEFSGGGRAVVVEGQEPWRWWEAGAYREASRARARWKQDAAMRTLAAKSVEADALVAAARADHRAEAQQLLSGALAAKSIVYVTQYYNAFEPFLWYGGCSPTAGAMVLNYWDRRDENGLGVGLLNRWYSRRISPVTGTDNCRVPEIIPRLRVLMDTDSGGTTSIYDIRPGMAAHVEARGYCDGGGPDWLGEFLDWHWDGMVNQINLGRPFVWSSDFYPGTGGDGHSVAAMGYESVQQNLLCHNTWRDCNVVEAVDHSGGVFDWSSIDGVTPSCYESQADIVLMSPRGASSWVPEAPCDPVGAYESGCGIEIQWAESLGSTTWVQVYYSLDAGVNWTFAGETADDGSYTWIPPSSPHSQARIRLDRVVYEGGQPRVIASDGSRGDFTVLPGVPHPCVVTVDTLRFTAGAVGVIDMKYFRITNNTCATITSPFMIVGSGEFTVVETSIWLPVGEYEDFHVYYRPVDCGPDEATLLFPGAPCASVRLIGQGPSDPICDVSPTRLDMPFDQVGQPVTRTFNVRNTKCGLVAGTFGIDDSDFHVSPGMFSLGPNDSLRVTVTFTPPDCRADTCRIDTGPLCQDVLCVAQDLLTPGGWQAVNAGPLGVNADGMSAAAGDYDQDGDDDLYVVRYNQPNVLLRNDGGLTFVDVTTPILADAGPGYGAGWGDIDNDGDLDLYVANFGTADILLRNNGPGGFAPVTVGWLGLTGQSTAVAWADIEGDGDLDIYVAGYDNVNMPLRNDGVTGFQRITSLPLADAGFDMDASWGDWDRDGDPDLFLVKYGQRNKLLRNDGAWAFSDMAGSQPYLDQGAGTGGAWGDMDNDGDLDLFLAKYTQPSRLYVADAGGVLTYSAMPVLSDAVPAVSVSWTDFDLDGDLDAYQFLYGAMNRLLRHDGGATWVSAAVSPLDNAGDGYAQAWADFDHDGRGDVYLAPRNAPGVLCLNQAADVTCRNWLQVDLHGMVSNRFGVGARITVIAGALRQVREVGTGEGGFSQNSLTASFGLGSAAVVDSLIVRWPWRASQAHTGLPVNRRLTIVEGGGVTNVREPDVPAWPALDDVALLPVAPNPFNPMTSIPYDLPRAAAVRLTIHDAAGRLVRTLIADTREMPGRHVAPWDGRDEAGRTVGSGVYFCRLDAGGEVRRGKMVLLR